MWAPVGIHVVGPMLSWGIARFYMVIGVPVRVPFRWADEGYKRNESHHIPHTSSQKPLTTVKVSMSDKPSIGIFKILSLTEGNPPASVNKTFIPYQHVGLNGSQQLVW